MLSCFLLISLEKKIGAPTHLIKKVKTAIDIKPGDKKSPCIPSRRIIKETDTDCMIYTSTVVEFLLAI